MDSCSNGFSFYVYKIGLTGDGVVGNVRVRMAGDWYPLWRINKFADDNNDSAHYPTITYSRYSGCNDNEDLMFFAKLPTDYFNKHNLKVKTYKVRQFRWGSAIIKYYNIKDGPVSNAIAAFVPDKYIGIFTPKVDNLNQIKSLEIISKN